MLDVLTGFEVTWEYLEQCAPRQTRAPRLSNSKIDAALLEMIVSDLIETTQRQLRSSKPGIPHVLRRFIHRITAVNTLTLSRFIHYMGDQKADGSLRYMGNA